MIGTVRCPKCNYTQLSSSTCKSCGKEIEMAEGSDMLSPSDVMSTSMAFSQPSSPPPGVPAEGDFNREIAEAGPTDETVLTGTPTAEPSAFTGTDDGGSRQAFFFGKGGTLFGIHIVNLFLTILTLGIFYFWGKVRVRKYLYSQTEFEGDRFSHHGTGLELLKGYIKGFVLFGSVSALIKFSFLIPAALYIQIGAVLTGYLLLLYLTPFALVGPHRYRMSRTSWRGIRFSCQGTAKEYRKTFIKDSILTALTLGFYYPFFFNNLKSFLGNRTYFGNLQFGYDGKGKDLFFPYLFGVIFMLPTLMLSFIWYKSREQRYLWDNLRLGTARFSSTITFWNWLGLKLGNFIFLVLTLGFAWPWIKARTIRYNYNHISLDGPLNLDNVSQDARDAEATGEGLGDMMNIEMGLGAG